VLDVRRRLQGHGPLRHHRLGVPEVEVLQLVLGGEVVHQGQFAGLGVERRLAGELLLEQGRGDELRQVGVGFGLAAVLLRSGEQFLKVGDGPGDLVLVVLLLGLGLASFEDRDRFLDRLLAGCVVGPDDGDGHTDYQHQQ